MLTDIVPDLGMQHVATVLAPGGVNNRTDVLAAAHRAGQKAIGKGV
jgi:hypothetical protein